MTRALAISQKGAEGTTPEALAIGRRFGIGRVACWTCRIRRRAVLFPVVLIDRRPVDTPGNRLYAGEAPLYFCGFKCFLAYASTVVRDWSHMAGELGIDPKRIVSAIVAIPESRKDRDG